jgi:pheromone shutdown protein TraB
MVYLGMTKGLSAVGDNLLYWVLITGGMAAFGAALALPHPLTILVAFVMAPLKPFRPFLGTGIFTSFTQAWLLPPRVQEMERVSEDISHVTSWWKNRLLRIVLCALLPVPFTTLAYFIAANHILRNLVP